VLHSRDPDPRPLCAAVYARTPKRAVPEAMAAKLRYYSASMHAAAFALPRFAEDRLLKVRPPATA
jgi:spermidine synthase